MILTKKTILWLQPMGGPPPQQYPGHPGQHPGQQHPGAPGEFRPAPPLPDRGPVGGSVPPGVSSFGDEKSQVGANTAPAQYPGAPSGPMDPPVSHTRFSSMRFFQDFSGNFEGYKGHPCDLCRSTAKHFNIDNMIGS